MTIKKQTTHLGFLVFLSSILWSSSAWAYTANQVSFEFRPNGIFRVYLYYTVPAIKEYREATVEFVSRKKAEKFYYDVLRGADFYIDDKGKTEFVNAPLAPKPW
jgi:hypothetical protein